MSLIHPTITVGPAHPAADAVHPKEERQLQLPIDKIVRATVAEGGQNRVILDLDQRLIQAETRVPLQTGQKLNLLVVATSPKIELQIIEDPLQRPLASALHLLGSKPDILSFIRQLQKEGGPIIDRLSQTSRDVLMPWVLPQKQNDLSTAKGVELLQFLQGLGLCQEANLAKGKKNDHVSLKSVLQEIFNTLNSDRTDLSERAARLIQHLELYQLCQIRFSQQGASFFPLPLAFLEQGYMVAEGGKRSQDDETTSQTKLTLHLSLQGLGDVRIDLLYDTHGLFIRFVCDSPEKTVFASGFQEELTAALSSFPLRKISFTSGAENPAKNLLKRLLPEGRSVLNTRV